MTSEPAPSVSARGWSRPTVAAAVLGGVLLLGAGVGIGRATAPEEETPNIPEPCERTLEIADALGSASMDALSSASDLAKAEEDAAVIEEELARGAAQVRSLSAHLRGVQDLCTEARERASTG